MKVHAEISQDEVQLGPSFLVLEMLLKFLVEDCMQEDLLPVEPLLLLSLQAAHNKVLHGSTNLNIRRKDDLSRHNLVLEAFLSLHGEVPWDFADKHLVCHDSERPNVTFVSIFFLL